MLNLGPSQEVIVKSRRTPLGAALLFTTVLVPGSAEAHPHVFAEARLDVVVNEGGRLEALRHVWRFDDLFSATVVVEFDKNGDLELDDAELREVSGVIYDSLEEFNYFQVVTVNDVDVELDRPEALMATMQDNQLIVFFEARPTTPFKLEGNVVIGVYDPTFYTAIDFVEDDFMAVENMSPACSRAVVRPDPDEAIAENRDTLTEAFFTDPTDYSRIFATRLELVCPPG